MPTREPIATEVVRCAQNELRQSLDKIEKALDRVGPEQIWNRAHENENAIGNLLLHLAGNVRQWIVCGIGGAPDLRNRPAEFAQRDPLPLSDLLSQLRRTVEEANATLDTLEPDAFLAIFKIQIYEVTGLQALLHVITHFAEHTGQILWSVKRMTGEDLGFYSHLDAAQGAASDD